MSTYNHVTLLGFLGNDPKIIKEDHEGATFVTGSLATHRIYFDIAGQKRSITDWHKIRFNGSLAKLASQYLKKGVSVLIEGVLVQDSWIDQPSGERKYSTSVSANKLILVEKKEPREESEQEYVLAEEFN